MPVHSRRKRIAKKSRCCYTGNRDNEHIQMWMKVRHLLSMEFNYDIDKQDKAQNHCDQQLLETNKQQFINAFGDINTILSCFITNADSKQLINIYNVLKTIKLNANTNINNDDGDDDDDDGDDNDIVIIDHVPKELDLFTMDEAIKMEQHWDVIYPEWKQDWPLQRCQNISNINSSNPSYPGPATISYAKMYLKYWKSVTFHDNVPTQQTHNVSVYRGFTQLSCVEIVNVCGFLQKTDILLFKATNFKIAIICLQEMSKFNIGVYDMNKLINFENKDLFKLNDEHFMSFSRYFPNIPISTIYEEWDRYFNIPIHRQLICEYNPFDYQFAIFTAKDMNNYNQLTDLSISNTAKSSIRFDSTCKYHWRAAPMITSSNAMSMRGPYLLFDMQNITILTPHIISNMYKYNELIKHKHNNNKTKPNLIYPTTNNNYSLLTIKYFDIMDQRLDVVNFICISCDVTFMQLFDYIENHFDIKYTLNTANRLRHSRTWYKKFKNQLSELNAYGSCISHCKYDGYIESGHGKTKNIDMNEKISLSVLKVLNSDCHSDKCLKQVFVFQFNANHPYFEQKIMEKESKTLTKTYRFCETFISDYNKFKINFKLSSDQLTHNRYQSLQKIYLKTHSNTANNIDQFIKNSSNVYSFECGSLWNFGLLRKKLASKLNCLPQFIEIYYATVSFKELKQKTTQENSNDISGKPMQRRSWSETVSKCKTYEWRLVEYNTETFNCANECIYQLKLILSDGGADALQHYTKPIDYPLFIKYKSQFKISELINFVNQHIGRYHGDNEELSNILLNMNANTCILTSFSRCYASNELFINQTPNIVTHLNIFSIENENINSRMNEIDNKEKLILRIRFVDGPGGKSGTVSSRVSYYDTVNKLVGIPYLVSFNKNDNLQTIIEQKEFDVWLKNNISCCYKFNGTDSNIVNVPRRAKSYKHIQTFKEIMSRDLNECLIIKLRTSLSAYRTPIAIRKSIHSNNNMNDAANNNEEDAIRFQINRPPPLGHKRMRFKMRRGQAFGSIFKPLEDKFKSKIVLSFNGEHISATCTPQKLIDDLDAKDGDLLDADYT